MRPEESGRGRLRVCATSVTEELFLRGPLGQALRRRCVCATRTCYMVPGVASTAGFGRLVCNILVSLAWNWKSSDSRSSTL